MVLDGPDGGGKSTQAQRLAARLADAGRDVVHVRDPGSTPVGERIREILLDPGLGDIDSMCEMLLYQAARAQLARASIGPSLARGRDVVCERWHFATVAYQGSGCGIDRDAVIRTSEYATGGVEPDLAILLDVAPEVALRRRSIDPDRIEARDAAYQARVAEGFRAVFGEDPVRRRIVDANGSADEVEAAIWSNVRTLLDRRP